MRKRFELKRIEDGESWLLTDQRGEVVRVFASKEDATSGGTLERLIDEGSVRIHREDGAFEEERTFPRSKDSRKHPG